jgi:hypothetical protein
LIKEIPIPRFTQQDIIDKRSYIPASGARYAKSRRSKYQSRSNVQQKEHEDQQKTIRSRSHDNISFESQQSSQQSQQTYFFHHYDKDVWSRKKSVAYSPELSPQTNIRNHSISSFDASFVPNDLNGEPSNVKNSLDYLSYAIAMTERGHSPTSCQRQDSDLIPKEPTLLEDDGDEDEDTDINLRDDVSPDWTRTSQLRLSLSIPNQLVDESKSSPASPASATNAAAQAMLMFVKREQEQREQSPNIRTFSIN